MKRPPSIDTRDDGTSNRDSIFSITPTLSGIQNMLTGGTSKSEANKETDPTSIHQPRRTGSFQGKVPFDDIDLLESGGARELLTEECLSPSSNIRKWTHCYVNRVEKKKYRMFMDSSNRFLLSAKQEGNNFYISRYDTFPEVKGHPDSSYCAVLRHDPSSHSFKLWLCGCEDASLHYNLEKFTCTGQEEEHMDGQLLAEVSHVTKTIKYVDAEMRAMQVKIPTVMEDKKTRSIWCPRRSSLVGGTPSAAGSSVAGTPRYSESSSATSAPAQTRLTRSQSMPETTDLKYTEVSPNPNQDNTIQMETRLPEWNEDLQSLVLKFNGGRVLAASAKNFLLCETKNPSNAVMQFGKARKGKFVLDYRYPMAPVQAFAISLSACAWMPKEKEKK